MGKNSKTIYTYLNYYKPYKATILMILGSLIIVTFLEIISDIFFKYTIDEIIPQKDLNKLIFIIILFIINNIIGLIFFFVSAFYNMKINLNVNANIKTDILFKLHNISYMDYKKYDQGYWFSRIQNDASQLFSVFTESIYLFLKSFILVSFSLSVLFYYNWLLTIIILLLVPVHIFFTNNFVKKIADTSKQNQEEIAQRDRQLIESLNMLPHCSENYAEKYNTTRYNISLKKQLIKAMKYYIADYKFKTFNMGIFEFIPLILISVGTYSIILNRMTVGVLLLFIMLSQQLLSGISQMFWIRTAYVQAKVNIERINEVFNIPDIQYNDVLLSFNKLELKNLCFSYKEPVLQGINLCINKGDKVAIFGDSGSGKTTLLKIIFGLLEPEKGEIFYNDISSVSKKYDLRKCFCAIWQESFFFNTSIIENAVYDEKNKIDEDLMKELNIDFISEENIGGNGNKISSGQKQRLSLLRGFLRKTDVILFDEPTANLDENNKNKIFDIIQKLPKNKTVIIVTHDYDFCKICNKSYILKNYNIHKYN